jgi:hypothetical protein
MMSVLTSKQIWCSRRRHAPQTNQLPQNLLRLFQ